MQDGVKPMKNYLLSCILKNKRWKWLLLLGICLFSCILNFCFGAISFSPEEVWDALVHSSVEKTSSRIILYTRLPRLLGSLAAGAALAAAGVIIQRILDNPLASPHVIGVNAGAGFMVALSHLMVPFSFWTAPIAAFLGAVIASMLVVEISRRVGASRSTFILSGIALSSIFSAGTDTLLLLYPNALNSYTDFRIGGFGGLTLQKILPGALLIFFALCSLFSLTMQMDILALGEDTAQSLGLDIRRLRMLLLLLASLLAGASISFAGLLGFVGLIVPHMMRKWFGEESKILLGSSILGGAALVSLCDLIARALFRPYELPVGIVMSLVGGPFFLWLIFHKRGGRSCG